MVKREMYLERIRPFYDSEMVKVISGIRRCDKSTIMRQMIQELKDRNISDKKIIYINFEVQHSQANGHIFKCLKMNIII